MQDFRYEDLQRLIGESGRWCVSIYAPLHPAWPDSRTDRAGFDNQVREARQRLETLGVRPAEARAMLEPARDLAAGAAPALRRSRGLAVFAGPGGLRHHPLPFGVEPSVTVAERFAIRPLLPVLGAGSPFFVLALARQEVRLVRCTRDAAEEVPLPAHPHSVAEATGFDSPQRGFAYHGGPPVGQGGRPAAIVHTIGVDSRDSKEDLLEYCRAIERCVTPLLRAGGAPLVLAGVEHVVSIYRTVNTYPVVLEQALTGSTGRRSADDLRRAALPLVEAGLQRLGEEALARYRQSVGTGGASGDAARIVRSAAAGRVATLLVDEGGQAVWGHFDPQAGAEAAIHAHREPGDEDLVGAAAAYTLLHRGAVHVVPRGKLPAGEAAAAIFRHGPA